MIGIGFRHSLQVQFGGDQVLVGEVTPEFLGPIGDIRRLALGLFSSVPLDFFLLLLCGLQPTLCFLGSPGVFVVAEERDT